MLKLDMAEQVIQRFRGFMQIGALGLGESLSRRAEVTPRIESA